MTFRQLAGAAAGLVLTASLVACTASAAGTVTPGGSSSAKPSAAPSGGGTTAPMAVTVTIKDFKFSPAEVTVKKGGSVTWKNEDAMPHDANPLSGGFSKTATLKTGESASAKFDTAGPFDYNCSLHPSQMKGKVTVVE